MPELDRICVNCQSSIQTRRQSPSRKCLVSGYLVSPIMRACPLFAPVQDRKVVTPREIDAQAKAALTGSPIP